MPILGDSHFNIVLLKKIIEHSILHAPLNDNPVVIKYKKCLYSTWVSIEDVYFQEFMQIVLIHIYHLGCVKKWYLILLMGKLQSVTWQRELILNVWLHVLLFQYLWASGTYIFLLFLRYIKNLRRCQFYWKFECVFLGPLSKF